MKYVNFDKLSTIELQKDNFYVLTDFDRTLTKGNSFAAWRVLYHSNLLGDKFKEEYTKIHDETVPNEQETDEVKIRFFEDRFKRYIELLEKCGFNEKIAKQAIEKTDLFLRDGAKEFLKQMYEMKVPVMIVSCSVGNVIKEFLKWNGCDYDNVYICSNFFDVSEARNHIYHVTPYNKNEISLPEILKSEIETKKYTLLCGDVIEDITMVKPEQLDNTITVGFLDKKIEQNLQSYRDNFDLVLTEDASFEEVLETIDIK